MSTPAPSAPSKAPPGPIAPPDDEFWEKYSPHYEFPLSSIGSIAMHVAGVAIFLLLLWLLSRMSITDTKPVPMIGLSVYGDGSEGEGQGSEGGQAPKEDVNPSEPMDPSRPIPEADLAKIKELDQWFPNLPSADDGPKPESLPTAAKIAKLNEDLRKALLEGMRGKKGKGTGEGSGNSGAEGKGSNATGDPTSSGNRAVRWELNFKTSSGKDYVGQLAVMKATLVIPEADDRSNKAYRDLSNPPVVGQPFNRSELPGLYFVDDSPDSAEKVASFLGLKHSPKMFIAFFPKDIEEELARKEREYRGRKESEIFSTKFKIMIRNDKPSIEVDAQTPVKR